MLVVFLDESGSPFTSYETYLEGYARRLAQAEAGQYPRYPFFILAAVALEEHHLPVVDELFSEVQRKFFGGTGIESRQEYEVKASLLYLLRQGKQPDEWFDSRKMRQYTPAQRKLWEKLQPQQLLELEQSVFDIIRRLTPVIWIAVVKQHHYFRRYQNSAFSPYFSALTYIQQRVVHFVQTRHGTYERALFLMDETATFSKAAHFDTFIATRKTINDRASWPVNFSRHLLDIPLFGKSHLHHGLQLADFAAYAAHRHFGTNDELCWFTFLEPFLAKHWSSDTYENAGQTIIR